MTPELSRAIAKVKQILNLEPGPQLNELMAASSVEDLPRWAQAVLTYAKSLEASNVAR